MYFELLRRGYQVNVDKFSGGEMDFEAQKNGILSYFQVTADIMAQETFERDMKPLRGIRDNYRKVVLTLDCYILGDYEDI